MTDNRASHSRDAALRLLGAWRLHYLDHADRQARSAAPAEGLIIYDASGYMSAQILSPGVGGSAGAEASEHHAYFGTYTIDAAASTVTHHRMLNSNRDAPADVVREYRFVSDNVLILAPQGHAGVQLTFRRAGR